jgi:hypothetical protein
MSFQKILVPAGAVAAVALAYRFYGWAGVVALATAGVMGLLLHFNRLMQVLKRAADRPIGQIDSAVMLNARLKTGMTLLHVLAMTRSLGQLQSEKNTQPEVFRWSDAGDSHVTCTFVGGRLAQHALLRPTEPALPPTP